ncbi:MAG TPA: hypothetical protein ENJ27_01590 [Candidatus Moranbacteria bacterium]|nr:hypothetical protein [Candidatus Moranbacteria bacterium]
MNFFKNCKCETPTRVLMALSFVALIFTVLVSAFGWDLWLAGTQWILVAILFAVYASHVQNCFETGSRGENTTENNE